jgi:hypothetical protein
VPAVNLDGIFRPFPAYLCIRSALVTFTIAYLGAAEEEAFTKEQQAFLTSQSSPTSAAPSPAPPPTDSFVLIAALDSPLPPV